MLSIIMPVYNTPIEFLSTSINSFMKLNNSSGLELIIIDDGSEENVALYCDKFADSNKNIKVVHKKNEGVSIARNIGIRVANGDYIAFLDSDDCLVDGLEEMIIFEHEADLVIFNYSEINETGKIIKENRNHDELIIYDDVISLTKATLGVDIGYPQFMLNTVWGKIYKKSIIDSNNIIFPKSISRLEDVCFNLQYVRQIKKLVYCNDVHYYYRVSNTSTVNVFDPNLAKNILDPIQWIYEYLKNNQIYDKFKSAFGRRVILNILMYADKNIYCQNIYDFSHRMKILKEYATIDINQRGINSATFNVQPGVSGKVYLLLLKLHCWRIIDVLMRNREREV